MQSGKVVILVILGLAVSAASLAWWHQSRIGRRAMAFWGVDRAMLLRHGSQIELWRLSPVVTTPRESATPANRPSDEQPWAAERKVDLTKAKGVLHARHALIVDASYDWDSPPPESPNWQYAWFIRNPNGHRSQGELLVLFDVYEGVIGSADGTKTSRLKIADGLRDFFEENLAE